MRSMPVYSKRPGSSRGTAASRAEEVAGSEEEVVTAVVAEAEGEMAEAEEEMAEAEEEMAEEEDEDHAGCSKEASAREGLSAGLIMS